MAAVACSGLAWLNRCLFLRDPIFGVLLTPSTFRQLEACRSWGGGAFSQLEAVQELDWRRTSPTWSPPGFEPGSWAAQPNCQPSVGRAPFTTDAVARLNEGGLWQTSRGFHETGRKSRRDENRVEGQPMDYSPRTVSCAVSQCKNCGCVAWTLE